MYKISCHARKVEGEGPNSPEEMGYPHATHDILRFSTPCSQGPRAAYVRKAARAHAREEAIGANERAIRWRRSTATAVVNKRTDTATSFRMSRVARENTSLELAVRRELRKRGVCYRLHRKDLPGSPDIFVPALRAALFVHGCFWHGHDCPKGTRRPIKNAAYWESKIALNQRRDARVIAELADLRIRSLVIWECQRTSFGSIAEDLRHKYIRQRERNSRKKTLVGLKA